MDTLKDIGNTLGEFIKVAEQTKAQRYTSFARICVYLDLSKELSKVVSLFWEDEEWTQPIDYEQIPFRRRNCHDYGHLGRNYPKFVPTTASADQRLVGAVNNDGFTQVKNRKRSRGGGASKAKKDIEAKDNRSKNAFVVLGDRVDEDKPKDKKEGEQPTKDNSAPER